MLGESGLVSAAQAVSAAAAPLLPLSARAIGTLHSLAHGELRVSPFCHEYANQVRGWTLDVPADASAALMPLPYNLFHGVSITLCEASEAEILHLMQDADGTRRRLGAAVHETMQVATTANQRATWARCRPSIVDGVPRSLHSAV